MKKVVGFIIVSVILLVSLSFKNTKNEDIYFENDASNNKNMLSMMLEQTEGVGDYKTVSQSSWPTDGYKFNKERSGCENGGELSWDDTKKTVIMSGNVSDKCYVYFDVWFPSIADYCTDGDNLASCVIDFGNQGSDISNIYIHNSTLANGAGDNSYRYAGPSEQVNNFVCFGSTENPCPIDNLYRIVGVIGGKVKLIKYDYANSNLLGTNGDYSGEKTPDENFYKGTLSTINTYYWNYYADISNYPYGSNTWSTSLFNKTNLNTNFINNIGSIWAEKIATTIWKVGGNVEAKIETVIPSIAYQNEIVNPNAINSTDNATEYSTKIGLMYVSDYYYSASPNAWTLVGYDSDEIKDYRIATGDNWMYMGDHECTLSRRTEVSNFVFFVNLKGFVGSNGVKHDYVMRPSFNLESFVTYKFGSGTMNNPIRIN